MKYRSVMLTAFLAVAGVLPAGCPRYGQPPETVPYVDLEKYTGLWYEIASNEVFFNENLFGVTAEYTLREDGTVGVVNTGYEGGPNGPKKQITGTATVADPATNSKLLIRFDQPFGFLFRGKYYIVLLDEENYEYAVVSDNRQFTLFVLSRTPAMDTERFNNIVGEIEASGIDISRLEITGELN
jgi:apolipoprotein D and lipocalin family protein